MSARKILIIDDEADFTKLVKKNLELTGNFAVTTAADGKRGLILAQKLKPDLILLDIMMPGIDGFKVLKKLKGGANTKAIPVIMLTAKGDEASRAKAAQLYGKEYITKPIEAPELKARIEGVLKRAEAE